MCKFAIGSIAVCLCLAGSASAQPPEGHDRWLMQNYKFVTPPPPEAVQPATRSASDLQEIQNTLLSIMRKANFAGDYEAALAAAAQAAANAQLMDKVAGQPRPLQPTRAPAPRRLATRSVEIAARTLKADPQR